MDFDSPELPASIRAAALSMASPGDTLWRCPRLTGRYGALSFVGIGKREVGIEWWLLDAQGELIEAFWEV